MCEARLRTLDWDSEVWLIIFVAKSNKKRKKAGTTTVVKENYHGGLRIAILSLGHKQATDKPQTSFAYPKPKVGSIIVSFTVLLVFLSKYLSFQIIIGIDLRIQTTWCHLLCHSKMTALDRSKTNSMVNFSISCLSGKDDLESVAAVGLSNTNLEK